MDDLASPGTSRTRDEASWDGRRRHYTRRFMLRPGKGFLP